MKNTLLAVCLMGLLASCSNQQLYDAARQNYIQQCDKWEGAERERCQARYQDSYEEYQRKRDDAMSDESTDN